MNQLRIIAEISSVALLVACESSGGGPDSVNNSIIESKFVGLWDITEDIDDETDVIYNYVGSDGIVDEFDYDGDTFDQGENCYYIYKNEFSLKISGSNYIYSTGSDYSLSVSLKIEDDNLIMTALESIDNPDNDPSVDSVETGDTYNIGKRITNISVTDLENSECT